MNGTLDDRSLEQGDQRSFERLVHRGVRVAEVLVRVGNARFEGGVYARRSVCVD